LFCMLPTTLLPGLLSLLLSQMHVVEAEVFVDQSTAFARAGATRGLKVGKEVWVVDAETGKRKGSAWVMELWENMARLNLDSEAGSIPGAKRIRFSRDLEESFCEKPMSGKARLFGVGAFQKLLLSNESEEDWTRCHLLLPTNRATQLERVPAKSTAEVFLSKFHSLGNVRIVPLEYVFVECLEGKAKFLLEP